MLQIFAHYGVHFLAPLVVALMFYKRNWKTALLIMLATFIIDIDHVLANPIFDASRCSINFHPLHSYYAMIIYALLLIPKTTRLIGLGLCVHILADTLDCLLM
jgi:hypothetical protein